MKPVFEPGDLHDLMCVAIRRAGGVPCEEFAECRQPGRMADLVFLDERIIVEVKAITSDRNKDPSVQRKAGAILSKWAAKGKAPVLFGTRDIWLPDLELEVADELLLNLGARVKREIAHANEQIRDTARKLNMDAPLGLCIFVTPGNFSTGARGIRDIAAKVLRPGTYRSLNAILCVESWTEPGLPTKRLEVRPGSRETMPRLPLGFVERLMAHWFQLVEDRTGEELTVMTGLVDPEDQE